MSRLGAKLKSFIWAILPKQIRAFFFFFFCLSPSRDPRAAQTPFRLGGKKRVFQRAPDWAFAHRAPRRPADTEMSYEKIVDALPQAPSAAPAATGSDQVTLQSVRARDRADHGDGHHALDQEPCLVGVPAQECPLAATLGGTCLFSRARAL